MGSAHRDYAAERVNVEHNLVKIGRMQLWQGFEGTVELARHP
jgi:hypothetical protein